MGAKVLLIFYLLFLSHWMLIKLDTKYLSTLRSEYYTIYTVNIIYEPELLPPKYSN